MKLFKLFNIENVLFSIALGFPYAVILIFSAYGPALHYISGSENNIYLSSIFLAVLMISMIVPPFKVLDGRKVRYILIIMIAVSAFLLMFFPRYTLVGQLLVFILLGFVEGRIAVGWSRSFISSTRTYDRVFILTAALMTAYFLLYLANLFFPVISSNTAAVIPSILLLLSIPVLLKVLLPFNTEIEAESKVISNAGIVDKQIFIKLLIIIYLIYITAGFTYTIIFPDLRNEFTVYRFYNVLPFVVVLPIAGYFLFKKRIRILLHIGIALLGISYIFYQFPAGLLKYFLVESFIQPGWAFLDILIWYMGMYFASEYRKSRYLTLFVAVFLFGTVSGAVLSMILVNFFPMNTVSFLLISMVPLFITIPALAGVQLRINRKADKNELLKGYKLTKREYEIAGLLIDNCTQGDICEEIHVSINTLKTHTRNIYRKLKVSSKKELISRYQDRQ